MFSTDSTRFLSDFEDVIRLFYPDYTRAVNDVSNVTLSIVSRADGYTVNVSGDGAASIARSYPLIGDDLVSVRLLKRNAKNALFDFLMARAPTHLPWGSMTGIRPTRIGYLLQEEGVLDVSGALEQEFHISPENAALVARIMNNQSSVLLRDLKNISLYVHIPICPSRCYYCSFPSVTTAECGNVDRYVERLVEEIQLSNRLIAEGGYRLRSVYVGGGTPTALDPDHLARVLDAIDAKGTEFTVEAGRPDTITAAHLDAMAAAHVTRVSVNPQTFQDATLARIGRNHSAADIERAFALARQYPFQINMDLIAGLEGETAANVADTVMRTLMLKPDNVTVHTLCLKRGSDAQTQGLDIRGAEQEVQTMVRHARDTLYANGYEPYYIYRQKNMLMHLDNTGYGLQGTFCVNNIDTMEETTSVIACGAGAIGKRLFDRGRIERSPNVKPIQEYLARFDQMCERKQKLFGND